ncbi:MAG: bifunctional 5,10-methylene-tetrahydrofolate dehydrogenase/5,10-methylene-tetrahydrofolate cyclohydrolase [Candidatus Marinimicrobia bacterium]|nr:bifunctional 5,10-methylene-tetrahydrofolate dehydrogenase/5,10-methylene-tetrahydrofolate cyclohydrolase [Candidatus Neomarinimicrobiota bacterium]|tara:strand:+ start:4047 stop:4928 length:882 start_codon:yes stop_codon:yes gene_type:complete
MHNCTILSGKEVSDHVYRNLQDRVELLFENNIRPGLAAVLVGENPASKIYIKMKTKKFHNLGLKTETFKLSVDCSQEELIQVIEKINNDSSFHGILVQLPLPNHIDSNSIINSIHPEKDVDGFHPENAGLLSIGAPRFIPCTPKGVMRMLEYYRVKLSGKHVVVLGRSNIVGRPMSILTSLKTKGANGTTTLCHSGSSDIEKFTKIADIVIVALGVPNYLTKDMIKKDAILIDVGINRVNDNSEKGYKLCGDVFWEEVIEKAKAVTPVPGGVGPMTIAMLVENTVEAAESTLK